MIRTQKIGFGGGCHWCTEAVFQQLNGVTKVAQGYISSFDKNDYFSEAVIVSYDPQIINLKDLIEIHLHTHNSTSNHSFRKKYRSAVYYFKENEKQYEYIEHVLCELQKDFDTAIIIRFVIKKFV
ncbi:peptide-methionine (S)-S-oxide reductase [Aquimarina sp. RZ0]|nr:peptide-methionine (S)-S-oxide reductase [Aquimarina sp. RZ0]